MEGQMTKQQLIVILRKLLETDVDLWFLDKLDEHEIQTLIACVRSGVRWKKRHERSKQMG